MKEQRLSGYVCLFCDLVELPNHQDNMYCVIQEH
jgi:hypothetical protein